MFPRPGLSRFETDCEALGARVLRSHPQGRRVHRTSMILWIQWVWRSLDQEVRPRRLD
jgi:hypothetical protein